MVGFLSSLSDTTLNIILIVLMLVVIGQISWMIRDNLRNAGFFHEEIATAAVRYPDIGVLHLPAPARHHHVMWARLMIDGKPTGGNCQQGFVTTTGRFVGREEGLRIAAKRGQVEHKHGNPGELYSEDMWPTPPAARGYVISNVDD